MKNFAVTLMESEGKYYVVVNDDNSVAAHKSVEEGLKSFEKLYNTNHARSYEGSMSACINWLFFRPAIVGFASLSALRKDLFAGIADEDIRVYSVRNVSGGFLGLLCGEGADKVWQTAAKPALITEEANKFKAEFDKARAR